jgi:hypothetical protein
MKKNTLVLILVALMAAFLSACDSDSSVSSMSLEPLSSMESSSSDSILSASSAEERRSSIIQGYLSSKGVSSSITQSSSSSSNSSGLVYYYGEMGEVCDGWINRAVINNQYYDAYLAMKWACEVKVISSTPDSYGETVMDWLDKLNIRYREVVTLDVVKEVSQGFNEYDPYFYVFDDAHKYIYVKSVMDGKGKK